MFKLQLKDNTDQYVMLTSGLVTLGRDPTNHFVISAYGVSDFHAEVVREGDNVTVVDLLSGSGTYVNEKRISGRHKLAVWDVIRLGNVELELNDPSAPKPVLWSLQQLAHAEQRFDIKPVTVIGRDPACDICLENDLLSRRHVELRIAGGHVRVRDLGSANGTYLNGRTITDADAQPGDELRIDPYAFVLMGPKQVDRFPSDDATQLKIDPTFRAVDAPRAAKTEDQTELIAEFDYVARLTERSDSGVLLLESPVIHLQPKSYEIGRLENNAIVIPDTSVSKLHATLAPVRGKWTIQDLGSSNGIKINGAAVQSAQLEDGDVITLGRATFVFALTSS